MGEYAEARLDGDDCQDCGIPFDDAGDGFPRSCAACRSEVASPVKARRRLGKGRSADVER